MVCCLHVVTVSARPQFSVIPSKIPQGILLQLVVKSDFYPSSSHFPPLPLPNLSSIHTFALFTPPFSCYSLSLLPSPPPSPQQPKTFRSRSRFTLCLYSTYFVPPAAFEGTPKKERKADFLGSPFTTLGSSF